MADDPTRSGMSGPRRLTYPVEIGGAAVEAQVPIVIGVIGDAPGLAEPGGDALADRRFRLLGGGPEASEGVDGCPDGWKALVAAATDSEADVRIHGLHITRDELVRDARKRTEESLLYRKSYEELYGAFGALPIALLLVDFPVSHDATDLRLLRHLANVGAGAGFPALVGGDPRWLGEGDGDVSDAGRHLWSRHCTKPYAEWQAFRRRPEAGALGLVLPGSAVEFGTRLVRRIGEVGTWAELLVGAGEGENPGDSDRRLGELGFISSSGPIAAARTARRPSVFHDDPERDAASRARSGLVRQLAASQFLNGANLLLRDSIGRFGDRTEYVSMLSEWVEGYVRDPGRPDRPLDSAVLALEEVLGAPGSFEVVLDLRLASGAPVEPVTRHRMQAVAVFF